MNESLKYSKILIVIPARLNSTRLRRKLMLELHGFPLIYWTVKRVIDSKLADVIVATDSEEIKCLCDANFFPVEITSNNCSNGTERVYQIAKKYKDKYDFFLNVQADEPLINIEIIRNVLKTIGTNDNSFKTAVSIVTEYSKNNPSEVKVAMSSFGRIRFVSRSLIPYGRDVKLDFYKIHGVYLYPYAILEKFIKAKEGPLEKLEKVEQMRCIENDIDLYGVITPHSLNSVDTELDFNIYKNMNHERFIEKAYRL